MHKKEVVATLLLLPKCQNTPFNKDAVLLTAAAQGVKPGFRWKIRRCIGVVLILCEKLQWKKNLRGQKSGVWSNLTCEPAGSGLTQGQGKSGLTNVRWQGKETGAWQSKGHGPVTRVARRC